MSMFPHTVTLYNVGKEDMVTFETPVNITVLKGVLLDASKAVNVRASGLEGADAVNLYIPFDVDAVDAVSLFPRRYMGSKEYDGEADKSGLWTLEPGEDCFFVKGEVVEPERDFQYIKAHYDDVYVVTKVDQKDFGTPDMQHWEVGGN